MTEDDTMEGQILKEYDYRADEPIPKRFVPSVRELPVYQQAYAVSLAIHRKSLDFPKGEQQGFAEQLRRTSKSICANMAEGFASQGYAGIELERFISRAFGAVGEMQTWIDYCEDLQYVRPELAAEWRKEYHSILRMLQKLKMNI